MSCAVPPWLPRYGTKLHQTPANIGRVRRYGQIHPLRGEKSSQPTVDPAPGTAARLGTAGAVPLALTPNRPFLRGNPRSSEANRGNPKQKSRPSIHFSEPIRTKFLSQFEPIRTYPQLSGVIRGSGPQKSEPIRGSENRNPNLSEAIRTYPKLSEPSRFFFRFPLLALSGVAQGSSPAGLRDVIVPHDSDPKLSAPIPNTPNSSEPSESVSTCFPSPFGRGPEAIRGQSEVVRSNSRLSEAIRTTAFFSDEIPARSEPRLTCCRILFTIPPRLSTAFHASFYFLVSSSGRSRWLQGPIGLGPSASPRRAGGRHPAQPSLGLRGAEAIEAVGVGR
jgi:hypothetical protein